MSHKYNVNGEDAYDKKYRKWAYQVKYSGDNAKAALPGGFCYFLKPF
jgi:hypothetical protein